MISKLHDNNLFSVRTYNYCAEVYEVMHMDITPYQEEVDNFCNYLSSYKSRILDMGCGPGNYSKYIFSKGFKNITGYDLSEEMIKRAKKNVPEGNFKLEDIRKVQLPPASCHGVFASFSIPYLSYHETDHFIEFSSKVLKHSGVLYISCIEGTHCGFEQMSFSGEMAVFIYHYTADFLTTAMEEKGFQILCVNRYHYFEPDGRLVSNLVIMAQMP
jgi:cyclopropane fatty-acyl-phospholipid synthase-like methyltransferase